MFWIPPLLLKSQSASSALVHACRGNDSYLLNVKHRYWSVSLQGPHPDKTMVAGNVRSLVHRQNQRNRGPWQDSLLCPSKRCVSVLAGVRNSSQGGCSVASTLQGHNSTSSSSLNNSYDADITHRVTSTPSATQ